MSRTVVGSSFEVLHIRGESAAESAAGVDSLLTTTTLKVKVCGDVYAGLAELCRTRPAPRLVVVCVDDLGTAELEFFAIAARLEPEAPVYVYGAPQNEPRVVRAIESGATGRVSPDILQPGSLTTETPAEALADPIPSVPIAFERPAVEPVAEDPAITPATVTPEEEDVLPETEGDSTDAFGLNITDESDADEATEADAAGLPPESPEVASGPARVPWLRYADRPVRTGPKRSAPGPSNKPADRVRPDSDSDSDGHQPLLSEAELQALIGDDVAAIAPERATRPGNEDDADEEDSA